MLHKRTNRKNSRRKFPTTFSCPASLKMRRRNLSPSWATPQKRLSETTSTSTVNKFSNSSINNSGKEAVVGLMALVQVRMEGPEDLAAPAVLLAEVVVGVINAVAEVAARADEASLSAAADEASLRRDRAGICLILWRILRSTLRRIL